MAFGGSSKQNKNQSSTPAFMPSVSGATFDKKSRPLASEHSDWIERDEQVIFCMLFLHPGMLLREG